MQHSIVQACGVLFFLGFILPNAWSGENWGGNGTYGDPAYYNTRNSDGTGYSSLCGQTIQTTSNTLGLITSGSSNSLQRKESFILEIQNNKLVKKIVRGCDNSYFESYVTKNDPTAGLVRIFNRVDCKFGVIISAGVVGENDFWKLKYHRLVSTAIAAANGSTGSITLFASKDHDFLGANQPADKQETVDFAFHFSSVGNGSWDYDFGQDVLGDINGGIDNVHLFENGDFQGLSSPTATGTGIVQGQGIGSRASDGIGINWIYGVVDAWDFISGILSHPSQFNVSFVEWTREDIISDWPRA